MLGFDAKPSVHDELRAQSSDFSEEMVIECLEDVVVWPAATGSLGGAVDGEGEGAIGCVPVPEDPEVSHRAPLSTTAPPLPQECPMKRRNRSSNERAKKRRRRGLPDKHRISRTVHLLNDDVPTLSTTVTVAEANKSSNGFTGSRSMAKQQQEARPLLDEFMRKHNSYRHIAWDGR